MSETKIVDGVSLSIRPDELLAFRAQQDIDRADIGKERINENIYRQMRELETSQARPVRDILAAILEGAPENGADVQKFKAIKTQIDTLRAQIAK
jgi:hypothetical protein